MTSQGTVGASFGSYEVLSSDEPRESDMHSSSSETSNVFDFPKKSSSYSQPVGQYSAQSDDPIYESGKTQESLNSNDIRQHNRKLTREKFVDQEHELLQERNELVDKELSAGLSLSEEKRLRYLGWQLDRIEDAQIGDSLDQIEYFVEQKELLGRQIAYFSDQVSQRLGGGKKRQYGSR